MIAGLRRTGWIGVDVGARAVKVAQLERRGDQYGLRAAATVPRRHPLDVATGRDQHSSSSELELRAALALSGAQGRSVAVCVPSMGLCDLRSLVVPMGTEAEQRQAIARRLRTAYGDEPMDRAFDFWHSAITTGELSEAEQQVHVLSLSGEWLSRLLLDVKKAGLRCDVVDGLPFALTRMIHGASDEDASEVTAVLDWGFTQATFCMATDGEPVFVRTLVHCGLSEVCAALCDRLDVSFEEAEGLLTRYGVIPDRSASWSASTLPTLIAEAASRPLDTLTAELTRTLSFLKSQRRQWVPEVIWMVGGGSAIEHADSWLTGALGIPVRRWDPVVSSVSSRSLCAPPPGILAVAMAASLVSWSLR